MRNKNKNKNKNTVKRDDDFSDLLPTEKEELREANALLEAQQTSWKSLSTCAAQMTPLMTSGRRCPAVMRVHSALLNHNIPDKVLKKTEFPSSAAMEVCSKSPAWKGLIKKMQRVQCRALTCVHSILSVMDTESLGGIPTLQALAEHLSNLVFSKPEIPKQEEFLEAVTSAVRSLLQIMASKKIPQCMSPEQLMRLSEAATRCEAVSIRVNALAILGITGSTLAREQGTAHSLQMIGTALLQIASKDHNMVVCGEALDALFDVFADGKEAEQAAKNINLLPSLKALQPVFKAKLRKECKGKYSPDQLCVLDNIKINLRRFIGYLETLE
ncbi:hypothetical protein AAFF_G00040320 [Aldrovandia affinis]|uniref:SYO1-like TPR repeats domain-containing protein n=1 Tax=Aldrovandia affinis TaxID=143900 RepID=A0AAD7S2V1_9TELE|nr:hypothetical protein AAFF_G00040320 [Aldrovandia affinis]